MSSSFQEGSSRALLRNLTDCVTKLEIVGHIEQSNGRNE